MRTTFLILCKSHAVTLFKTQLLDCLQGDEFFNYLMVSIRAPNFVAISRGEEIFSFFF